MSHNFVGTFGGYSTSVHRYGKTIELNMSHENGDYIMTFTRENATEMAMRILELASESDTEHAFQLTKSGDRVAYTKGGTLHEGSAELKNWEGHLRNDLRVVENAKEEIRRRIRILQSALGDVRTCEQAVEFLKSVEKKKELNRLRDGLAMEAVNSTYNELAPNMKQLIDRLLKAEGKL